MATPASKTLIFKIIWGALTASQLLYAWVLFQATTGQEPLDVGRVLPQGMLGVAGVFAAISLTLFLRALNTEPLRETIVRSGLESAIAKRFALSVICWAFNEVVCLCGFVLAFATHEPTRFLPFLGASLALQLYMYPRWDAAIAAAGNSGRSG